VSDQQVEQEHPVTPLELYFDLVFVFAFTQVTTLLSDDPTWAGLGSGLLILAALWWAWASYAWLTNTVDPGEGAVWGAMLVAMAAMFSKQTAVSTFGARPRPRLSDGRTPRARCAVTTRPAGRAGR
jgi:low temperature requirement protein LtrA